MQKRRVVISGVGMVSGLGIGADAFWQGLLQGRSAIAPIRAFDATAFPVSLAAELNDDFRVRDFVPKSYRKATKVMCRDIELAVAAAAEAIDDGGVITSSNLEKAKAAATTSGAPEPEPTFEQSRFGCQIGAGLIVADINEISAAMASAQTNPDDPASFNLKNWGTTGMENLTPLWLLKYLPNMLACHVTIVHDCRGPSNTITCTEVAGGLSVGEARRVIERGDAEICFAGGVESKINPLGTLRQSFTGMTAETTDEDLAHPTAVVQPFSTQARGTIPGEGGALLLIEEFDSARNRKGKIYGEIVGFGASQSFDLQSGNIEPSPDGAGVIWAIEQALADARITPDAIDAIVPMGFAAPSYDTAEMNALQTIFGSRLIEIPIVTTKPNVGNCAAGAGAIDLATAALCLIHQKLPARINGESIHAGLNAKTIAARNAQLEYVLVCGTGVGGQNTAVVLRRIADG